MICVEELKCDFRDAQIGDEDTPLPFFSGTISRIGDIIRSTIRIIKRPGTRRERKRLSMFFLSLDKQRLRLVLSVSPLFCGFDAVLLYIALRR
jgi:hypothetical protein